MAKDYVQSVAEVYAQAIFKLAEEKGLTDEVGNDLDSVSKLVSGDKDFAEFLASPSISQLSKSDLLGKVFAGKVNALTEDTLGVLARRDRLEAIVALADCYRRMLDEKAGRIYGTLTTAVTLSETEFVNLKQRIGEMLGKEIVLKPATDPDIIGGMILKIGNKNIDGSLRRRLTLAASGLRNQKLTDVKLMIEAADSE